MWSKKPAILLALLILASISYGQTFDKNFHGSWAWSFWSFHFQKDGSFQRYSSGHFGNTTVNGRYILRRDTVEILEGWKNSGGTIARFYLLDTDGMLIDLHLGYDYAPLRDTEESMYNSRVRKVHYPYVPVSDPELPQKIETFLNQILNAPEVKAYFHFEEMPERKLKVQHFHHLKADLQVDGQTAHFLPQSQLKDGFFLKFEEIIYQPGKITVTLLIHDEGVRVSANALEQGRGFEAPSIHITEK